VVQQLQSGERSTLTPKEFRSIEKQIGPKEAAVFKSAIAP